MLLHDARRAGAPTAGGDIVLLEEQDRSLWDRAQIDEGLRLVEDALRVPGRPQPYAVQAAIAALHARAPSYEETDWPQIAGLYEVLLRISPSPVIELNHAAAVSMVDGPARALDLVDALAARGGLDGYDLLPAVRADLLRRLGRQQAASEAYLAATAATQLEPLRRLYARRMREMEREYSVIARSLRRSNPTASARGRLDCFASLAMTRERACGSRSTSSRQSSPPREASQQRLQGRTASSGRRPHPRRAGRKWRWNAVTTSMVAASYLPVRGTP